ncbi:MAG: EamA family transporter [bacterium]|nr:EamA family transporter [bacterium]
MSWIIYALIGIVVVAASDIFRKLASNLHDPFFTALIFQIGSIVTTVILYLLFSRKIESNTPAIGYAFAGGVLIAIFTLFSFKALSTGPGVSTVIPILRVGGIALVVIFGIVLLREKMTLMSMIGLILSLAGIYFMYVGK